LKSASATTFDEAYYQRFYFDKKTSVADPAHIERLGTFVCSYLQYLRVPVRRVLDVGCGAGVLQQRMAYGRYVGVDMNASAIVQAQARATGEVQFLCAPVQDYVIPGEFDVIVFNESLYYMPEPLAILQRHLGHLKPDGVVIICMFQTYLARRIWQAIDRLDLEQHTMVELISDTGFTSVVKVLGRRRATAS